MHSGIQPFVPKGDAIKSEKSAKMIIEMQSNWMQTIIGSCRKYMKMHEWKSKYNFTNEDDYYFMRKVMRTAQGNLKAPLYSVSGDMGTLLNVPQKASFNVSLGL